MRASARARTTAEEGSWTANLLFALTLTRPKNILSKTFPSLAVLVGLALALFLTLIIGVDPVKLVTPTSGLIAISVELILVGSHFTGVALHSAAHSGHKGIAHGASIAFAVVEFVLFSLAPFMKSIER